MPAAGDRAHQRRAEGRQDDAGDQPGAGDGGDQPGGLLIDADLRKPRLYEIFKAPNEWGLGDLLLGKKPPEGSVGAPVAVGYKGLYPLPAGTVTTGISSLLYSPRLGELLRRMWKKSDLALIDTPPLGAIERN